MIAMRGSEHVMSEYSQAVKTVSAVRQPALLNTTAVRLDVDVRQSLELPSLAQSRI